MVPLDPLSLEIGYGLIPLVDKEQGAELLDRITRIRRESALELGLVVPRIRIIDNMRLEPAEYSLQDPGRGGGPGRHQDGPLPGHPAPARTPEELAGEPTRTPPSACRPCGSPRPSARRPSGWATRWSTRRRSSPRTSPRSSSATPPRSSAARRSSRSWTPSRPTTRGGRGGAARPSRSARSRRCCRACCASGSPSATWSSSWRPSPTTAAVTKDGSFLVEKVRQALGRQICLQYCDEREDPAGAHDRAAAGEEDHRLPGGDRPGPVIGLEPALHRRWITACRTRCTRSRSRATTR